MSILQKPIQLGALQLKNRIIMSPLTRCRADENRVPTDLMATYYAQRATAGMIIAEATSVSPMGVGYPATPGIWNEEQITGWKKIVDAVHQAGSLILLQLWHTGRISDPSYLDGKYPISASAVQPAGHPSLLRPIRDFVTPRAMTGDEIKQVIEEFKQAAVNAKQAGFDGVEIHGANGYLLDQFLQDSTNQRTDDYGGNLVNRARLLLDVADAVCAVWGSDRVGMHLAPRCDAHDMGDSNPLATFTHVAEQLGKRKLAFICARAEVNDDKLELALKTAFQGNYIINQQLTKQQAENAILNGHADAAAWGRAFIANPDLVERLIKDAPLNQPKKEQFYLGDQAGYTDYPTLVQCS